MKPETLDLLCNPYKGEPFKLEGNQLVGVASGQTFPIIDGIPHILDKSALKWRDRWYRWFYDVSAFGYDTILGWGEDTKLNDEGIVREAYISKIEIKAGERVLETSIGTGLNIPYLPKDANYYGIDLSSKMLRRAKENLKTWGREAELFMGNGAYLPFRDETFNVVLQMGSLQFYGDPFRGVSEMGRVVKPGGKVIILDELSGAVRTLKRMPAHTKYSKDKDAAARAMTRLVPHSMVETESAPLPNGNFYALTFQKPRRS